MRSHYGIRLRQTVAPRDGSRKPAFGFDRTHFVWTLHLPFHHAERGSGPCTPLHQRALSRVERRRFELRNCVFVVVRSLKPAPVSETVFLLQGTPLFCSTARS